MKRCLSILLFCLFYHLTFLGQVGAQDNLYERLSSDTVSKSLTEIQIKAYEERLVEKILDFGNYLEVIANDQYHSKIKNEAQASALHFFDTHERFMEVASTNNQWVRKYPLPVYLRRLRNAWYEEVTVQNHDIHFKEPLKKQLDGNYHGAIATRQYFEGKGSGSIYADHTEKVYEVVLKRVFKEFGSKRLEVWQPYLSNIRVNEVSNPEQTIKLGVENGSFLPNYEKLTKFETVFSQQMNQTLEQQQALFTSLIEQGEIDKLANYYLQFPEDFLREFKKGIALLQSSDEDVKIGIETERFGKVNEHVQINFWVDYVPMVSRQALRQDPRGSYADPRLYPYLTALRKQINILSRFSKNNVRLVIKISGFSYAHHQTGSVAYQGEFGEDVTIKVQKLIAEETKNIQLKIGQFLNLESLATLRTQFAKGILSELRNASFYQQIDILRPSGVHDKILHLEITLQNAAMDIWKKLPHETQEIVQESLAGE